MILQGRSQRAISVSSAGWSRNTAQCGLPIEVAVIFTGARGLQHVVDHRRSGGVQGRRDLPALQDRGPEPGPTR